MYSSYSPLQRTQLSGQVYTDTQSLYLLVYAPGRRVALENTLRDQLHQKFRLWIEYSWFIRPISSQHSTWLLHEAFCLHGQADIFHPYEKHHSTVKDAAELAESLGVKNLLLYHTEDKNIARRKELYTAEGRQYFHGNLFVPEDLEVIEL